MPDRKKEPLDPKVIQEISERLQKGEHLWRLLDQYELSMRHKLELLQLFDDQKWD